MDLEYKAYWETRQLYFDMQVVGEKGVIQLNDLDEFHNGAYENPCIYKEKTKVWPDKHITSKEFFPG